MTNTLLTKDYKQLVSSFTPENELTITMADVKPYLNGDEAEAVSQWLTSTEIVQLNKYSFEKRRHEWLSGRICVKQAVLDLLKKHNSSVTPGALDFTIEANDTGRPFVAFLNPADHPDELEISISHSHGKAAGMAGKGLCGIDIQLLNNTLFRVKDRYCTDIESAIMDVIPADELTHLGMLWVAKEAIRKCLSGIKLVGFQELKLTQVNEKDGYYLLHFHPAIANIDFLDSVFLSVITNARDSYAVGVCTIAKGKINAGTA